MLSALKSSRVFLCHASEDKVAVRKIYTMLKDAGLNPWLDKEDLLPGQEWGKEIPDAIRSADFMMIFFSSISVAKRGFVQKEFKLALDVLAEIPEGDIFVIPVRLDECDVPDSFKKYHYVDLFESSGMDKVLATIKLQEKRREREKDEGQQQPSTGSTSEQVVEKKDSVSSNFSKQRLTQWGVGVFILLLFFLLVYQLFQALPFEDDPTNQFKLSIIAEEENEKNTLKTLSWWINTHGSRFTPPPNNEQKFITVWDLAFEKGRILYSVSESWVIVLDNTDNSYVQYSKPSLLITYGPGNRQINYSVVEDLLKKVTDQTERAVYEKLVEDRALLGGMGTLFIRERLLSKLGKPIEPEEHSEKGLFYGESDHYFVIIGIQNNVVDKKTKIAYVFRDNWVFEKYTHFGVGEGKRLTN